MLRLGTSYRTFRAALCLECCRIVSSISMLLTSSVQPQMHALQLTTVLDYSFKVCRQTRLVAEHFGKHPVMSCPRSISPRQWRISIQDLFSTARSHA